MTRSPAPRGERSRGSWRDGPWRLSGEPASFALLRTELDAAVRAGAKARGERALDGPRAYLKASPLARGPALRHAARAALRLAAIPRLQELRNLEWLRAHGFLAVRPIVAGVRMVHGLPRYQFLATELEDAPTLAALLTHGGAEREPALRALAGDLARMHALGFVHRDLFPRNVLVRSGVEGARCVFLDAWRGVPGRGRRPPEHDLGCFFLDGARLLTSAEQSRFLSDYREARAQAGARVRHAFERRVVSERASAWRRESGRGSDAPRDWQFPS